VRAQERGQLGRIDALVGEELDQAVTIGVRVWHEALGIGCRAVFSAYKSLDGRAERACYHGVSYLDRVSVLISLWRNEAVVVTSCRADGCQIQQLPFGGRGEFDTSLVAVYRAKTNTYSPTTILGDDKTIAIETKLNLETERNGT